MKAILAVIVNGEPRIEYHRDRPLPSRQRQFLDSMDRDMDAGITLAGTPVERPNPLERAQFMATHMVRALQDGNEALAAATCSYLADRLPDLKQVRAVDQSGAWSIDLVFDETRHNQVRVELTLPGS